MWKERNERIFKGKKSSLKKIISIAMVRIAKWVAIRKNFANVNIDDILFANVNIDDILHNWGACMGLHPRKIRVKDVWCPPPRVVFKLMLMVQPEEIQGGLQ